MKNIGIKLSQMLGLAIVLVVATGNLFGQGTLGITLGGDCNSAPRLEYRTAAAGTNKCGYNTFTVTSPPRRYLVETITQSASTHVDSGSLVQGDGGSSK